MNGSIRIINEVRSGVRIIETDWFDCWDITVSMDGNLDVIFKSRDGPERAYMHGSEDDMAMLAYAILHHCKSFKAAVIRAKIEGEGG